MGYTVSGKMGLKDELAAFNEPSEDDAGEEVVEEEAAEEAAEEEAAEEEAAEEEAEEEEEEEDLVDPMNVLREECSSMKTAQKLHAEFERCQERVMSKSQTEETCEEEFYDFLHVVDHCVAHSLFAKLK